MAIISSNINISEPYRVNTSISTNSIMIPCNTTTTTTNVNTSFPYTTISGPTAITQGVSYSNKILVEKKHPTEDLSEEHLSSLPYRHLNLSKKTNLKLCEEKQLYYVIDNTEYLRNNVNGYYTTNLTPNPTPALFKTVPSKEDMCVLKSIEESPEDSFPIKYVLDFYNFDKNENFTITVGDNSHKTSNGTECFSVFKINTEYKEGKNNLFSKTELNTIKKIINKK